MWYGWWIDGQWAGTPLAAKLLAVRARLAGRRDAAALVAVSAEDGDQASDTLRSFLSTLRIGPALAAASAPQ